MPHETGVFMTYTYTMSLGLEEKKKTQIYAFEWSNMFISQACCTEYFLHFTKYLPYKSGLCGTYCNKWVIWMTNCTWSVIPNNHIWLESASVLAFCRSCPRSEGQELHLFSPRQTFGADVVSIRLLGHTSLQSPSHLRQHISELCIKNIDFWPCISKHSKCNICIFVLNLHLAFSVLSVQTGCETFLIPNPAEVNSSHLHVDKIKLWRSRLRSRWRRET